MPSLDTELGNVPYEQMKLDLLPADKNHGMRESLR
jgi:hypothetical protein